MVERGGNSARKEQPGHAERHGQRGTPERRCNQGGGDAVEAGLKESLARSGQPALCREGIKGKNGQAGHGHRHAHRVDEQRHDAPRQAGWKGQVQCQIERGGSGHDGVADRDGAAQRDFAG